MQQQQQQQQQKCDHTKDWRIKFDFSSLRGQGDGGLLDAAALLQRGLDLDDSQILLFNVSKS